MTRIFESTNASLYTVRDSIVLHGYAALSGSKTASEAFSSKVLEKLSALGVSATLAYHNTPKQGYLYFIYDTDKFLFSEVTPLIEAVDLRS